MKKVDKVSVFSCLLILISINMPYFISFKTSRIAFADEVSAKMCFGNYYFILYIVLIFIFVLGLIKGSKQKLNFFMGCLAAVSLAVLTLAVSMLYDALPFELTSNSRMTFGVGFLISVVALYSIMIKCGQYLNARQNIIVNILAWGSIAIFMILGYLDNFSVMREYLTVKNQFFVNVLQHIKLSISVLIAAVIVGVPAGYLCSRYKLFDSITLVGISIAETIPTLALFAVMRIPLAYLADKFPTLSAMGIGSFGVAPAFAALLLYGLYLMIHNSRAAFNMIDESLMENAYAMGMTKKDVFFKVQLPMAMPILLTGVRITLVGTLVAASLASYIGGGGLGTYIVNGINALAIDMQLLGVIPIFILTICADRFTRFLFSFFMPGKRANFSRIKANSYGE